jgi:hypothetical protein
VSKAPYADSLPRLPKVGYPVNRHWTAAAVLTDAEQLSVKESRPVPWQASHLSQAWLGPVCQRLCVWQQHDVSSNIGVTGVTRMQRHLGALGVQATRGQHDTAQHMIGKASSTSGALLAAACHRRVHHRWNVACGRCHSGPSASPCAGMGRCGAVVPSLVTL